MGPPPHIYLSKSQFNFRRSRNPRAILFNVGPVIAGFELFNNSSVGNLPDLNASTTQVAERPKYRAVPARS